MGNNNNNNNNKSKSKRNTVSKTNRKPVLLII